MNNLDRFKRVVSKWLWLFSLIISLANIVVVCLSLPADYETDFDYLGLIVGSFSILVTVLIGWNIYAIVDMKHYTKSLDSRFDLFGKEFRQKIDSLDSDAEQRHFYTEGKSAFNMMNVFIHIKNSSFVGANEQISILDYYILYYGIMSADNSQFSDRYNNVDKILPVLIQHIKDNSDIVLNKEYKQKLLRLLGEINKEKYPSSIELWSLISGLKEVDESS